MILHVIYIMYTYFVGVYVSYEGMSLVRPLSSSFKGEDSLTSSRSSSTFFLIPRCSFSSHSGGSTCRREGEYFFRATVLYSILWPINGRLTTYFPMKYCIVRWEVRNFVHVDIECVGYDILRVYVATRSTRRRRHRRRLRIRRKEARFTRSPRKWHDLDLSNGQLKSPSSI